MHGGCPVSFSSLAGGLRWHTSGATFYYDGQTEPVSCRHSRGTCCAGGNVDSCAHRDVRPAAPSLMYPWCFIDAIKGPPMKTSFGVVDDISANRRVAAYALRA